MTRFRNQRDNYVENNDLIMSEYPFYSRTGGTGRKYSFQMQEEALGYQNPPETVENETFLRKRKASSD